MKVCDRAWAATAIVAVWLALAPGAAVAFSPAQWNYSQRQSCHADGLAQWGCWNYYVGYWQTSGFGGYGNFDCAYAAGYNAWFGLVVLDYQLGQYTGVFYVYSDNQLF